MRLTLIVNNTDQLNGGAQAMATFDESGGTIGRSAECSWILLDRRGSVGPEHVRVHFVDDGFCLEVLAASGLRINGASTVVEQTEQFRISDGDVLLIGVFEMVAYVTDAVAPPGQSGGADNRWGGRFTSVGALVGDDVESSVLSGNLFESQFYNQRSTLDLAERIARASRTDPMELMEADSKSQVLDMKDPIAAFERDRKDEGDTMAVRLGDIIDIEPERHKPTEMPDDHLPGSAHMSLPVVKRKTPAKARAAQKTDRETMDDYLQSLAETAQDHRSVKAGQLKGAAARDKWLGQAASDESDSNETLDHVIMRPLCQALGLPVQSLTVPQANELAREIGAALRAAIEGLVAFQRHEISDKSLLAETHLHAIEDNPLRLNQSVDDTVKDLFLIRSPVHLSAAAAIGESLELLKHHQKANEIACDAALDRVLQALGPIALARRFLKYKGHAPRAGDLDAWHWTMYQHYFSEMRSDQQGGLSRMFWEVYAQIYDREMRQCTMDS